MKRGHFLNKVNYMEEQSRIDGPTSIAQANSYRLT